MRMWKVVPNKLCRKHLLGEHVELHMFVGTIRRKRSLAGFIDGGLVEVHHIRKRHEQLVAEMKRHGYNHQSPLPMFVSHRAGQVDVKKSIRDLKARCEECKRRIQWTTKN